MHVRIGLVFELAGQEPPVLSGEFFRAENGGFERVAHLRPFPLPGGEAAIAYLGTNKPDLIILDMIMPDMGGEETYDRLKNIDEGVTVLLSSGYSINGEAKKILSRGCNGFIQKPYRHITHHHRCNLNTLPFTTR